MEEEEQEQATLRPVRGLRLNILDAPASSSPSQEEMSKILDNTLYNTDDVEDGEESDEPVRPRKRRKVSEVSDAALDEVPMLTQQEFVSPEEPCASQDLKCRICGVEYQPQTAKYYDAHMAQHTCPICQDVMPLKDIVQHTRLHLVNHCKDGKTIDIHCKYCTKRFKTLVKYETHLSNVHRCPVCEQCFTKRKVIYHIHGHFNPDGTVKSTTVEDDAENKEDDDHSPHESEAEEQACEVHQADGPCDTPPKTDGINQKKVLPLIIRKERLDKNNVKEEDNDVEDLMDVNENEEELMDNEDPMKSEVKKRFSEVMEAVDDDMIVIEEEEEEDEEYHDMDDHNGLPSENDDKMARANHVREMAARMDQIATALDGKYKCKMCNLVVRFRNRMYRHIRKGHYCEFCKDFFPKESLMKHLRTHDVKDRNHVCELCNDEFVSAMKLHYHDCSNSKKATLFYHCKICAQQLASREALIAHIRTHEPESFQSDWERNACQLCGYVFLGRPNLVRHMQNRSCAHCGLQTVSSCQHQKHILSHHNSKAYNCEKCDVQFMSQHSYVDHLSERECSGCNEMFEPGCEYLKHEQLCKTGRTRDESEEPQFSCLKCHAVLFDTYVYDVHVRDHTLNPLKNVCKQCSIEFKKNREFGIHMSKRTCPQCGGKFQPMCHWTKHTCYRIDPPTVSCPKCNLVFNKASAYRKHCKVLRCHSCPKLSFNSVCELNKHNEDNHAVSAGKNEDINNDTESTDQNVSERVKVEDYDSTEEELIESASTSATSPPSLQFTPPAPKHLAKQSCPYCKEYQMPMSYSKLRRHLMGSKCTICKDLVAPFCRMNGHFKKCAYNLNPSEENEALLENEPDQPVNCPLCRLKLKTLSGLKSHLRMTEVVCKECGEQFKTPCVYRMHQNETQHGQRDCICPICSKGFQYSRDLKKHLLIHTGERPYDCLICGNSYKNPGHLSYHLKVQHGGARPYKCKYCGRGFGAQSGCSKHELRHEKESDHKCGQCGMMFVAAHSLTKHIASKVCDDLPKASEIGLLPNLMEEGGGDRKAAAAAKKKVPSRRGGNRRNNNGVKTIKMELVDRIIPKKDEDNDLNNTSEDEENETDVTIKEEETDTSIKQEVE